MPLAQAPNMIPALPEILLAVLAMALLMLGVFQRDRNDNDRVSAAKLISPLGAITLILVLLLVLTVNTGGRMVTFSGLFVSDSFAVFFKVLILIASTLALIISQDYMERQNITRFEFPILMLFATLGMMMMISADDIMSMYLGLEIQSLSLYVLAAFQKDTVRSTEAGLKYFVLGALASGMLLYGASLVYGFAGATGFQALADAFHGGDGAPVGVIIGLVFILAGLSFKVSAVPFHMWTPDVYEGAPTPVTAFFSVAPKIAAIGLFVRVMVGPFGDLVSEWQQIVMFIAAASMVLGAFAAIAQTNIKRMMAYSSIGHVGYALIGLAVGDQVGVQGLLIYLSIYLFMNIGVFAIILCMSRGERMVDDINDLAGLGKTHPMLAFALAIFMFSMAGIPPLAGFFGKLYIFMAAIKAELYVLAVIGVLASVVSAFVYIRIVKIAYFDEAVEALNRPVRKEIGLVVAAAGVFVLLFFIYPGPVMSGAEAAAAALFAS